jgi:hypothetical protein
MPLPVPFNRRQPDSLGSWPPEKAQLTKKMQPVAATGSEYTCNQAFTAILL